MPDASVSITPGSGVNVRTDAGYDPFGDLLETQAVVLVDDVEGATLDLLTESTGRQILNELRLLTRAFCNAFGQPYLGDQSDASAPSPD
jgi:hypothetical protein